MKKNMFYILTLLLILPCVFLFSACTQDTTNLREQIINNAQQIETGWTENDVRNVMRDNMPITDTISNTTYLIYAFDFGTSSTSDDLTIYVQLAGSEDRHTNLVTRSQIIFGHYITDITQLQ